MLRPAAMGFACVASLLVLACGAADSAVAGAPGSAMGGRLGARGARQIEAVDLLPADLDLVVRVDVERMIAAVGSSAAGVLVERAALERGVDADSRDEGALFSEAMRRASVVWIGLRLVDIEAGDRVVVIEGDMGHLGREPRSFRAVESDLPGVSVFERGDPAPRAGTARIIRVGERVAAFVSPIEVDGVARVLRDGTDERRGDPAREGVISVDVRARRLPASLERRFPSIGAIIGGLRRVRAAVIPVDEGLRVDAEIHARNKLSAERARGFLATLRDNVDEPESRELMRALNIEQIEDVVRVRWSVPASALAKLVQASAPRP